MRTPDSRRRSLDSCCQHAPAQAPVLRTHGALLLSQRQDSARALEFIQQVSILIMGRSASQERDSRRRRLMAAANSAF